MRDGRISLALTFLLLALAGIERLSARTPGVDADKYHTVVRVKSESLPFHFDQWFGVDVAVPQAAVTLLKPNFIISRRYTSMDGEPPVTLLIVHCKDSRDLLGHYPPVCYGNQGWTIDQSTPSDWLAAGRTFTGMRYRLSSNIGGIERKIVIDNVMLLPNRSTGRNMDDVEAVARDSSLKGFGAAQVQLIYDASVEDDRRDALTRRFLEQIAPLADEILDPERTVAR